MFQNIMWIVDYFHSQIFIPWWSDHIVIFYLKTQNFQMIYIFLGYKYVFIIHK
jgi:hypothetical protein